MSAKVGVPVNILGFSFKKTAKQSCIDAFKKLPTSIAINNRDCYSHKRMQLAGISNANLYSDLAFLLEPSNGKEQYLATVNEWIFKQNKEKQLIVGVNLNFTMLYKKIENNKKILDIFLRLINLILENKSISILFIPHDRRNNSFQLSDWEVSEYIEKHLAPTLHSRLCTCPQEMNSKDAKYLAGKSNIVLTGRMHLAIAALSQGKSVIGLGYQNKFNGIFKQFDLEENIIDANKIIEPDLISKALNKKILTLNIDEEKIKNSIEVVKSTSKRQLDL